MSRGGWTLHEMLISMCVMSGVVGLAAHAATSQLRFFRGIGEIVAVRGQLGQVGAIAASVLGGVSPGEGDVIAASDSSIEVRVPVGTSVVCEGAPGRVTIPARVATGNALSAFDELPALGDEAHVFIADSIGAGWVRTGLASGPTTGGSCLHFPGVSETWVLQLREPLAIPAGSVLRVSRPMGLSVYRASDGRWYFGGRDWNGPLGRLNVVQPIAGPLKAYSADPSRSGLTFRYYDRAGAALAAPVTLTRIARVTVHARAEGRRPVRVAGIAPGTGFTFADSALTVIGLRNAP